MALDISLREWAEVPDIPAVFSIWAGERSAYLARTTVLGRRLRRVMRLWDLESVATRIEYTPVHSAIEGALVHYSTARRLFPDDYAKRVKLRMPSYVKLIRANRFPRTQTTARLAGSQSLFYGPFRTRASADQFEARVLELFQLRRCQEDLSPAATHPGCIYGEMNMCLRPCQEVVTAEEYATEAARVAEFLHGDGVELLNGARAARDRLSGEMDFEEAARQHRRAEKIEEVIASRDELAHDVEKLNGVAIAGAGKPDAVTLWFLLRGWWQAPLIFPLEELSGSLDKRLRELVERAVPWSGSVLERQEHLAILARWRYSSWADGEWLPFDSLSRVPFRKMVNAIARTVAM